MLLLEDEYSKIFFDSKTKIIKLQWLETTGNMTDDDFKDVSTKFAESAEKHSANGLLVEVINFKHKMQSDIGPWRKKTLIPKYHNSGAPKFAFIHSENFQAPPTNGQPIEGENFITKHFASEEEATSWILDQ